MFVAAAAGQQLFREWLNSPRLLELSKQSLFETTFSFALPVASRARLSSACLIGTHTISEDKTEGFLL